MENNKKEYKSTIHAFITAKQEIEVLVNNAEAFNFKFADLPSVQAEVNRVLKDKGLDLISMIHKEYSNEPRIYKSWDKIKKEWKDTTAFVSKGTALFKIGSIWDNELLDWEVPADFENGKPHDATYGANSISYRYFYLRAFGIPTMDENDARLKDKIEQENNKLAVKKSLSNPDSVLTQFASDNRLNPTENTKAISEVKEIKQENNNDLKVNLIKNIIEKSKKDELSKTVIQKTIKEKYGNQISLSSLTIEQLKELL